MESRWKSKALSRWSSVLCNAPSNVAQKSTPSLLIAPIVSAATGTNKYDWTSDGYLFVFLSAAASAAAPGVWDVSCTYDWASVSLTVTSHVTHFPCFHGSSVTPSGRFPSVLSRPDGSFNARENPAEMGKPRWDWKITTRETNGLAVHLLRPVVVDKTILQQNNY